MKEKIECVLQNTNQTGFKKENSMLTTLYTYQKLEFNALFLQNSGHFYINTCNLIFIHNPRPF